LPAGHGGILLIFICRAEYLGDYRLRVRFDDGREGVADLRPTIFSDPRVVFTPLRDLSVFQQLFVEGGALCWPSGLDLAPEYLYFLTFGEDESLRGLFEEWGYIKSEVPA
jgi:hypothetical protein